MEGLDKKYNFVKRRQLDSREIPKRFKKLKHLIDCQQLGLKPQQYKQLKEAKHKAKAEIVNYF
jgi:hypothetical protein